MGNFGEPWEIRSKHPGFEESQIWTATDLYLGVISHQQSERVIACVNACAGMENPEQDVAAKDVEIAHLKEYNQQLFDANAQNARRGTPEVVSLLMEIAWLKNELEETMYDFNETNQNYADLAIEGAAQRGEIARLKKELEDRKPMNPEHH